jgi:acetylornithine/succinyldiaminopimelate/putrescine aminotransferase
MAMKYSGTDTKDAIIERFSRHVSSGKVAFFKNAGIDFVLGKREGPYIWDSSGTKRLINCNNNGGVFNLGHMNPEIRQVLKGCLEELDIGNHHLISEQRALLAQRLAQLTPGDITYTVFGVGGGEAIDCAIKLARGYTKRLKIISALGGYHGHTGLALATGDVKYHSLFGPQLPGFVQVPFNDKDAIKEVIDENTAAVIFETIPATLGMPIPSPDYFSYVKDLCEKNGALLIMDEVQTGLGRTGRLWGVDHFDVVPDIMVIAKGLSGGIYPISATCFRAELQSFFHEHPFSHISTYGGAELGCRVALAVLEKSSRPEFLEHVTKLADIFKHEFETLKKSHPEILVGLRQLGLMMGFEMVNENCGPIMSKTCYDNGILCIYANNDTRVSQLLPPLIISEGLAYEIIERIDKSLDDAKRFLGLA